LKEKSKIIYIIKTVTVMRQTVIGFFNNASDAERAAEQLKNNGFSESDIDVSTRHAGSSDRTGSYTSGEYSADATDRRKNDDTPYSISDESRYRESGSDITNDNTLNQDRLRERRDDNDESIGDSIGRFFRNLFDNKEEAERYTNVGRKNSIVSVYAESATQAERARDILDECGAVDVDDQAGEVGSYTDTQSESTVRDIDRTQDSDYERRNSLTADGLTDNSLPVIEENMDISKREVQTGGVRLRSRIVERPVEENLRLRQERVRVERVPVDRPATERDLDAFREGEIEVTETSEVPVVRKDARVVEEVRLTKDVNETDEVVRDSVRKTDVEVENLSDESLKSKRPRKKL
jgi:stress response protein YsnF